jgi:hypothetical protein
LPPAAPAPAPAPAEPFAPPAEAPAEKPAPAEVDDLFKEPGATEKPGEGGAAPPATTPPGDVDDLFKEPGATEKPAEPAAPATPPGAADDLFKEPAPGDKPAAPAAPKGEVDDLFKVDDKDKKASLAPPAATPQELEDLFSVPAVSVGASAQDKALQEEADRLFGTSGDTAMRVWTDNTGKHRVLARLVSVSETHVRLLKENGKYTTVPFERLSDGDLAFVRQHSEGAIAANF